MRNKYFVSIIWGYSERFYDFAKEENPYFDFIYNAVDMGFKCKIITPFKEDIKKDKNLPSSVEIIDYKNVVNFIFFLLKFSFLGAVFYVNSLDLRSFIVPVIAKKTIFMAHTQPKRQNKFKQIMQRFIFKLFKIIRLNNKTEKDFLINDGVDEKKLFILPLVVSQNVFIYNDSIKRGGLVCLGNVTEKKNILTILKAFELVKSSFPDLKIDIIGEMLDLRVKKFAESSEYKKDIIFHGFVKMDNNLSNILNTKKIYLNSSYDEGQCVAVFDAALCGCALCLPNIMSFKETFFETALFHEPDDYQKLSDDIMYYLKNQDIVEKSISENLDFIKNNFNQGIIYNKIKEILKIL